MSLGRGSAGAVVAGDEVEDSEDMVDGLVMLEELRVEIRSADGLATMALGRRFFVDGYLGCTMPNVFLERRRARFIRRGDVLDSECNHNHDATEMRNARRQKRSKNQMSKANAMYIYGEGKRRRKITSAQETQSSNTPTIPTPIPVIAASLQHTTCKCRLSKT